MRIMLINHYAGSPDMGMEFRPYYFAREWMKMGHEVWIVAGDCSHLRKNNPQVEHDFQKETVEGVNYVWVKTGQYQGNGAKRALTMFRFVGKLWKKSKWLVETYQPDVVITSSTYPIDTFAGQRIAKCAKARLIHEVHDMWPATLYEIGGMSKWHPFVQVMQLGENSAYKNSDKVVSLLPHTKEYMMQHGMGQSKFCYIPNGVVLEDWDNPQELSQQHRETLEALKNQNKFIVGYFGGHAISNNLSVLIDVAKCTTEQNIHYVLVGNGVEKASLIEKCKQEKMQNVTFLPPIVKNMIPNLIKYFDCSYIGAPTSSLYRFGICANKIYDSMMAGCPIIAAIDVDECEVQRHQCGLMAASNELSDILNKVIELYEMESEMRMEMGMRGKCAVISYYNYERLAQKSEELFLNN